MTSLARTFCTLFAVAILAALNLHGVTQSQHAMAHVADWPAVALVDQGNDHDHHAAHVHVAPDELPNDDEGSDSDGDRPIGHHHHGLGESQGAMPVISRDLSETPRLILSLGVPGSGPPLSSLTGDGPEHPPKRMRTVV
ncbi:hypothetical protein [Brevundimonas sp.]|uniref:hypothetical protein n=1 Tax=Brevundimonas sp. TaxID=1871086 RepID=UPI0035666B77